MVFQIAGIPVASSDADPTLTSPSAGGLSLQGNGRIRIKFQLCTILVHDHLKQLVLDAIVPVSAALISMNYTSALKYLYGIAPFLRIIQLEHSFC